MTAKAKETSAPKKVAPKTVKKVPAAKKTSIKEAKAASSSSRKETLKISVKAFEHRVVDEAVKKIVSAAKDTGSQTV